MKKTYYFAYGSNLSLNRIDSRVGSFFNPVRPGTPHILRDYRLVFNCGSMCYANIEEAPGEEVHGLLYDLNASQMASLDRYEAFYHRYYFDLPDGSLAIVYIHIPSGEISPFDRTKPMLDYLNVILRGAKENGMDVLYNQLMDYKKQNYKLKKLTKNV